MCNSTSAAGRCATSCRQRRSWPAWASCSSANEPDDVTIRLPLREDLTNDGTYFHGGVIASVMDTTGAAAAWSNHDFDKGMHASTIAMSIQYVGAAKRSDLVCHGRTVRRRKELTFTEITTTDADGNIVAHAVQTYRIV